MVYFSNEYLTKDKMAVNADYIMGYLLAQGWTKNAVAGVLGNMESESTLNPGLWESRVSYDNTPYITVERHGYGLVQWTPFNNYTIWARDNGLAYNNIDSQLKRILWEVEHNQQWINVLDPKGRSFKEFTQSQDSPYDLAMAFIKAYERPKDQNQPDRGTQAQYWYDTLDGSGVIIPPDPNNPKGNSKALIHMLLADTFNGWRV